MSDLLQFTYEGQRLRSVRIDGEPFWVLADVCAALAIRNARDVAARLDDDEKGVALIDTPGGAQQMVVINEPGLYEVIVRSDKPEAAAFRRWITREVLPQIRRTGGYQPERLTPLQLAERLVDAERRVEAAVAQVEQLTPSATAWDELADASGDYDSRTAAQILSRAPGVEIGQNRLREYLREIGWTDRSNRPYQRHIITARLCEKVRRWTDKETGEIHVDHQLRITAKGIGELLQKLAGPQLTVVPDVRS